MIKPDEKLSKGNYLSINNEIVIVKGLPCDNFIQYSKLEKSVVYGEPAESFEPIPISEQWLIDFNLPGRDVIILPPGYKEYSVRNDFEIYCYMDESGNCIFWIGGEFIVKCDSVHVFQNIYNILSPHEELTKQ